MADGCTSTLTDPSPRRRLTGRREPQMSHLSRGGMVHILDDDGCARGRISSRAKGKAEREENKNGREDVGGQRRRRSRRTEAKGRAETE